MDALLVSSQRVLASWQVSDHSKLEVVTEAEKTSFHLIQGNPPLSEVLTCEVRGWIGPKEIEWSYNSLDRFYQNFRPRLTRDKSTLIFTLFETAIVNTFAQDKPIAALHMENESACLIECVDSFWLSDFVKIPRASVRGLPEDFWKFHQSYDHKFTEDLITKIEVLKKYISKIHKDNSFYRFDVDNSLDVSIRFRHEHSFLNLTINRFDYVGDIINKAEKVRGKGFSGSTYFIMGFNHSFEPYLFNKLVGEYNINEGTVFFFLPVEMNVLQGTEPFSFTKFEAIHKVEVRPTNPPWRKPKPGLVFFGECTNRLCRAFREFVYISKGFGEFRVNKELVISTCPLCNQEVTNIRTCGVFRSAFHAEGELVQQSLQNRISYELSITKHSKQTLHIRNKSIIEKTSSPQTLQNEKERSLDFLIQNFIDEKSIAQLNLENSSSCLEYDPDTILYFEFKSQETDQWRFLKIRTYDIEKM